MGKAVKTHSGEIPKAIQTGKTAENKTVYVHPPYLNSLNGLKVIGLLLMLWWHAPVPRPPFDMGARMCELLFVCSGFLVGYNNYKRAIPATWKESFRFASRLLLKSWPLHLISLAVMIVYRQVNFSSTKDVLTIIINAFLLQSWSPVQSIYFSFNMVSWFLSSLLFCYFLAPLMLRFLKKPTIAFGAFLAAALIRYYLEYITVHFSGQFWNIALHTSPVVRSLEFFMAMMMTPFYFKLKENASLNSQKNFIRFSIVEVAFISGAIYLMITKTNWTRNAFVWVFCFLVFILAFDTGIVSKFFSLKPFIWFSKIQIEFLLTHQTIIFVTRAFFGQYNASNLVIILVIFIITVAFCVLYNFLLRDILTNLVKNLFKYIYIYIAR